MRITVRIDDELLGRLKAEARRENVSLTRLVNRTLEAGLDSGSSREPKRNVYREEAYAMGIPKVPLDKALDLAVASTDDMIDRAR